MRIYPKRRLICRACQPILAFATSGSCEAFSEYAEHDQSVFPIRMGRDLGLAALAITAVAAASVVAASHLSKSPVACSTHQTNIPSAQLDLRPGLDDALCAVGLCGVAYLAPAGSFSHASIGADLVLHPAGAQCSLVVDVFRRQQFIARRGQHRSSVSGHSCHRRRVLSA